MIAAGQSQKAKYIFDGYLHDTDEAFLKFTEQFGVPAFTFMLTAELKHIKERWCKKNEQEEVPGEELENMEKDSELNKARRAALNAHFEQF